jgi:uncharacterized protein with GYD domain
MQTFIFLCKFTAEGMKGMREGPQRRQRARDAIERLGGRSIGSWLTQGRYDLVLLVELPDEKAALSFALETGMAGRLTTETLRAFTPDESDPIVTSLPG